MYNGHNGRAPGILHAFIDLIFNIPLQSKYHWHHPNSSYYPERLGTLLRPYPLFQIHNDMDKL